MNTDQIEEIKSAIVMAASRAKIRFNTAKYCFEKEPSESNKDYFRIDNNNLNTLQAIEELISELEQYPED